MPVDAGLNPIQSSVSRSRYIGAMTWMGVEFGS